MSLSDDQVRRLARLARIGIRPEESAESDRRELHQSVAPAVQEGLYLVPKVIE